MGLSLSGFYDPTKDSAALFTFLLLTLRFIELPQCCYTTLRPLGMDAVEFVLYAG